MKVQSRCGRWQSRRPCTHLLSQAPKLQLSGVTTGRKKTRTYQKEIRRDRNKKGGEAHSNMIKNAAIPLVDDHELQNNYNAGVLPHKNESSDPLHKAPQPGVQHWEDKPTEHLALKASRLVLRG